MLPGCLVGEYQEETVTLNDPTSGAYTIVLRNVQTDGRTPREKQEDFQRLIDLWRGDRYLLERLRGGLYVRERRVALEGEQLVARESGLFLELPNMDLHPQPDGTVRRMMERGLEVVTTNGRVVPEGDSAYVEWPKDTREFHLETRNKAFHPTADLVGRFRVWSR